MLRFNSNREIPSRGKLRQFWRLGTLVALLGLVIAAIRTLQQPSTADKFATLFASAPQQRGEVRQSSTAIPAVAVEEFAEDVPLQVSTESIVSTNQTDAPEPEFANFDLSVIRDNTYFRPEESAAWFGILQSLNKQQEEGIRQQSVGSVTYAQLLQQPNVYRGKVVTIRGTVVREERMDAPANDVGIRQYHRLTIRPQGGGVWPFVVYCLELPNGFPPGNDLRLAVSIHGVFFKNWSYAWQDGLGLAPVVLAKCVGQGQLPHTVNAHAESAPVGEDADRNRQDTEQGGFREVLSLAGVPPDALEKLIFVPDIDSADRKKLVQVFKRLTFYSQQDLARWTISPEPGGLTAKLVGELCELQGTVSSVTAVSLPEEYVDLAGVSECYRCQLKIAPESEAIVLVSHVPRQWLRKESLAEPVSCRAVLLSVTDARAWFVADVIRWFPQAGVPPGQLLLARYGVDAGLWATIEQREPLQTSEKSREAEAFYGSLDALAHMPAAELAAAVSAKLAASTGETEVAAQKSTAAKLNQVIANRAEQGLSSVAPLFLEPQSHVGELERLAGTARRAVRVVIGKQADEYPALRGAYFELELFTSDSQNLPIVCCVPELPAGFPQGDAIEESVVVEGVFFKSWLYRSRKLIAEDGQTGTQQSRYTPLLVARVPTWLTESTATNRTWQLIAGVGFLFALACIWLRAAFVARREPVHRPGAETIDFSKL